MRLFSSFDRVIKHVDTFLALTTRPTAAIRPNPGDAYPDSALTPLETKQVIALMRINHAGEIAAQGLYQGQALTAKLPNVRQQMLDAASEEIDHLGWCRARLDTLNGRVSYLDPLWYLGSLVIGATAGAIGDAWSLGFIAETERQVGAHLQQHLQRLPTHDLISQAILQQMQTEEQTHADTAIAAGAKRLPSCIQHLMQLTSKIMVTTAAYF